MKPKKKDAIGILELNNVSRGIVACDAMLKRADVECLGANPICPGKYVIIVAGLVADVASAVETGIAESGEFLLDSTLIPNLHEQVFPAVAGTTDISADGIEALGVMESFSVPSAIIAADTAVKSANVSLIQIRLGMGLGGKSIITLTGFVGEVEAAIKTGVASLQESGALVGQCVIPSPHPDLRSLVL
ncbi:MAG: propanediol utilization protein [Candidatus Wallbacteria bacterium HGW-Wallbacteria-1]|jgi:microcompartment protein CcmL/EutN|uniref:Propanediol utilization protein n=1 Tax=Candidatus Wallbacteria bacterium HGW-Wallbacteria-1 TaxID=2013854 RepID=A0A2N1PJY6_9BACT|nr:MAG: propanediol utilization protein [Candidatus Wallbacteria bacterium HGW-Wallbacteria-1]